MNFEKEENLLDIHFKFNKICSLALKTLKTLKKQQENELLALQIAFFKSISTTKSFVSKESFHTFLSTIIFVETQSQFISQIFFIFSFTSRHMQSLLSSRYEKRLTIFKTWSHQLSSLESFAIANFYYEIDIENLTTCSKCDLTLANWKSKRDSLRTHMRQSSNCFFAQALSKDQSIVEVFESIISSITSLFDIDENFVSKSSIQLEIFSSQAQNLQQSLNISKTNFLQAISLNSISIIFCFEFVTQSTSKLTIEKATKTSKSKIIVININFFNFIMQLNFLEFHLFNISVNFLQNLDVAQYKKQSVLDALIKCLRDSTHAWFKAQTFTSLHNFKVALANAFSSSTSFETSTTSFDSILSHSSSQYHICFECNAQFSSISRLLQHAQKNCFKLVCKHCEKDFDSNNKLHEHVRLKHARRFVNSLKASRVFLKAFQSSILTFKTWQTSTFDASSTSLFTFSIVFKKFVETLRHRLKEKKNKLSFTSSKSTILATSTTSRLFRLSKLVQLSTTSFVNSFASRAFLKAFQSSILTFKTWQTSTFDALSTQSSTSSHTSSLQFQARSFKLYMTIDDFYIMFHEKSFKKSENIIQKRVFSSMLDQTRIIDYFKFVALTISINKQSSTIQNICKSFARACYEFNESRQVYKLRT